MTIVDAQMILAADLNALFDASGSATSSSTLQNIAAENQKNANIYCLNRYEGAVTNTSSVSYRFVCADDSEVVAIGVVSHKASAAGTGAITVTLDGKQANEFNDLPTIPHLFLADSISMSLTTTAATTKETARYTPDNGTNPRQVLLAGSVYDLVATNNSGATLDQLHFFITLRCFRSKE
jgi:hypothetical protein